MGIIYISCPPVNGMRAAVSNTQQRDSEISFWRTWRRHLKHCPSPTQEQMALFVRNKWLKDKNTRQFVHLF